MTKHIAALAAYVACIVLANVLTNEFGMVPVWFGLLATAGTYSAGLALLARDVAQDVAGRLAVVAAIVVGAGLSAWLSTPKLALASGVAFLVAESLDMAVYTPLREKGWARAVLASNIVGGVVDTFVFLWLADFPITSLSVGGQLAGKLLWATLIPVLIVSAVAWRARRHRAVSVPAVGA
jgi:queuosine precursor transporter